MPSVAWKKIGWPIIVRLYYESDVVSFFVCFLYTMRIMINLLYTRSKNDLSLQIPHVTKHKPADRSAAKSYDIQVYTSYVYNNWSDSEKY